MIYGLSGAPVPTNLDLPFADEINQAAEQSSGANHPFSPCGAYAIGSRETLRLHGQAWNAATVISPDGGHGVFQLTSWVPKNWDDPKTNAYWAIMRWLNPDMEHYHSQFGLTDLQLLKAVADAFNAGDGPVDRDEARHSDPDAATTGSDYGHDVCQMYEKLIAGERPF